MPDGASFACRVPTRIGRWGTGAALGACAALLVFAAVVRPGLSLESVVAEHEVVLETAQVWVWVGVVAVVGAGCLVQPVRRGLLLSAWLGVLGTLAGMRELDLHVLLNPDNIHYLGLDASAAVHFRSRWWLSAETSVWLRAGWALVFGACVALVVLPFALARYPWPQELLRRCLFPWLIAGGFGMLGLGFMIDDVVGRPLREQGVELDAAEELVELGGVLLFFAGAAVLALGRVDLRVGSKPVV